MTSTIKRRTKNGIPTEIGEAFGQELASREERMRQLGSDPSFKYELESIRAQLVDLQKQMPDVVRKFFGKHTSSGFDSESTQKLIAGIQPPAQQVLQRYASFSARFRVGLRFKNGTFAVTARPITDHVATAVISGSRLVPPQELGNDLIHDNLFGEGNELPVNFPALPGVRIVTLKEPRRNSLFNVIENHFYDPFSLTFVVHEGYQPFLYCLIGENISVNKVWKRAAKAVTYYQKFLYSRSRRGRPTNIDKFDRAVKELREPGPIKSKAADLMPEPSKFDSTRVYLSKVRKRLNHK